MKYKRKSEYIEAVRFDEENLGYSKALRVLRDFCPKNLINLELDFNDQPLARLYFIGSYASKSLYDGDWLIKDSVGELRVLTDEDFHEMFEVA